MPLLSEGPHVSADHGLHLLVLVPLVHLSLLLCRLLYAVTEVLIYQAYWLH